MGAGPSWFASIKFRLVPLRTGEEPWSPVPRRMAIVRKDRDPGHPHRVIGVVYPGFRPLQNRTGAKIFDGLIGGGNRVYHTGGYLGRGEVVWLLARIDKPLEIARGDNVNPYILFSNSHDGSKAIHMRLTTIRVVCQNTLALAMKEDRFGRQFRRSHHWTAERIASAAAEFFDAIMKDLVDLTADYKRLTKARCSDEQFIGLLNKIMPEPKRPPSAIQPSTAYKNWRAKVENIYEARKRIATLRDTGRGMDLDGSRGTCWGALNAVIEFVDHHQRIEGPRVATTLLGAGMALKMRAYNEIAEIAKAA
jgi:phage/plasmid-like protein (TIGR03299 family)